jgi:signal transduction histidine kinase
MEASAPGGVCLRKEPYWDDSVEFIAAELQTPLELLKQSAEGLAEQLREGAGDPYEISAAETLVHSAERMRRIVQALLEAVHGTG